MNPNLEPMTTKKLIIALLFCSGSSTISAHPDGAVPFWYPASYIYGFVNGCAQTVELRRAPITAELWPDEVRSVCGCIMDSLRHALTFEEAVAEGASAMQLIVSSTMPICIQEELARKGDNSGDKSNRDANGERE